jgi:hypothetical protein
MTICWPDFFLGLGCGMLLMTGICMYAIKVYR